MADLPQVAIYTDGGCNPNPGPGGWAAILLFPGQGPHELVGSEPDATNNRMELRAAIEALSSLPRPHRVEFHTDSEYLRRGITEWLPFWRERNWQTVEKNDVKNRDLWRALAEHAARHEINWHWIKGHASDKWNERADELARSAIPALKLPLEDEQAIHVFVAVSYLGKAKRGGWGVLLRYRGHEKTLSGVVSDTSSNRLHIRSAIQGLQAIQKRSLIHLYTTSDYLKNGATRWIGIWRANDWRTREGKAVRHRDLWEKLASLSEMHQITWHVVGGEEMPDEMKRTKRLASEAVRTREAQT